MTSSANDPNPKLNRLFICCRNGKKDGPLFVAEEEEEEDIGELGLMSSAVTTLDIMLGSKVIGSPLPLGNPKAASKLVETETIPVVAGDGDVDKEEEAIESGVAVTAGLLPRMMSCVDEVSL